MVLIIQEIRVKSILTKSGIPGVDYCINPYVGCYHACRYCYATFMKRYTGHTDAWGSFVDVKLNAPEVLQRELKVYSPLLHLPIFTFYGAFELAIMERKRVWQLN